MRTLRRMSQTFFLLLFLWLLLLTRYGGSDVLTYPVTWFFQLDPLAALSTALSAHDLPDGFLWAAALLALTALLGRFFCAWVCPLGTLCHATGTAGRALRRDPKPPPDISTGAQRVKYYVLAFVLAASLYSVQPVGILDPFSLATRSISTSLFPAADYALRSVLDFLSSLGIGPLDALAAPVRAGLDRTVLLHPAPAFHQSFLLGLLFLFVVGLSLYRHRFWCRVLCPLGALLGLVSRLSRLRLRREETCGGCGMCRRDCAGAADPHLRDGWKQEECYLCWNCVGECPTGKAGFGFGGAVPARMDDAGRTRERRRFMAAAAGGIAFVPLIRTGLAPGKPSADLIRPPGSAPEEEFLARCIRCGECMKVCPTNAVHPASFQAGIEGLWTPVLDMNRGYCEFSCTLCGQVCPTHAIRALPLEVKQKTPIGLAVFQRGRCFPWAMDKNCVVCEEHCPTPVKAIFLREETVTRRDGTKVTLSRPYVDSDLCIGCGNCQNHCPILGDPAIVVLPPGSVLRKG
jgi:MauM/NapG family ferredoxin protein